MGGGGGTTRSSHNRHGKGCLIPKSRNNIEHFNCEDTKGVSDNTECSYRHSIC